MHLHQYPGSDFGADSPSREDQGGDSPVGIHQVGVFHKSLLRIPACGVLLGFLVVEYYVPLIVLQKGHHESSAFRTGEFPGDVPDTYATL